MTDNTPCARCPHPPEHAVSAHGATPARLLLLSDAPRYHEEHQGLAFASPAFAWLQERLSLAGLDPQDVHYATLIGCRPPHQRPIRSEEIAACAERLDDVIARVQPQLILLCGPHAVAAMLPGVTLGTGHGDAVVRGRRRYVPIRHPYAAMHYAGYIAELEEDLRHVAALLHDLPPLSVEHDIVQDVQPLVRLAGLEEPNLLINASEGAEQAVPASVALSDAEDLTPLTTTLALFTDSRESSAEQEAGLSTATHAYAEDAHASLSAMSDSTELTSEALLAATEPVEAQVDQPTESMGRAKKEAVSAPQSKEPPPDEAPAQLSLF